MNKDDSIYVAGHRGLVGSAIVRRLHQDGFTRIVVRTRAELDLRDPSAVARFFESERPAYVFLAAALVGGIVANNSRPAEFLTENIQVQTSVIDAAYRFGTRKLLFLGSSCIYPKQCPQPIREEYLLTGPLEPTNEWYAIAKIAGLKMCQAYRQQYGFNAISAMPTNLYGPGDNVDLESSHVLPALMRKCHEAVARSAREVVVWGTGTPRREFLYVDDLADALIHLMHHYDASEPVNVGWGRDISIAELAALIADIVGFKGDLRFDASRPDGTPRKLLDISRILATGWRPKVELREGIERTYGWFRQRAAAQ